MTQFDGVLSRKFVEEVSPRSGRTNVAHGVSRGLASPPSPPSPLPLGRERGAEGGVRALHPRACALGYNLPPLTGLRKGRPHEEDFVSDLLPQDNSWIKPENATLTVGATKRQQAAALQSPARRAAPQASSGLARLGRCLFGLLLAGFVLFLFCVVQARVMASSGQGQESTSRKHDVDVPALLQTAQDALGRKDFAAAADVLKQVTEAQPTLTAAWFNLAYAYTGLHKDEEAVATYRKALELDPNLFEARLNLGILLLQLKNPQGALEHLEKAATLKPDHVRAQLYLGRALALSGEAGRAEKQYQIVLRLDPGLAIAHYDLGQLYLQQKRYQEALGSFQKASEREPTLSQAQLGMALAMEGLKDEVNAAGHFEQYLTARPDDLETRFHLARLYLEQGKNEQAYESLEGVYRVKPETAGLAAALGDVCALLKKFPESEKFYRQALLATPADPDLHRALGQALLAQAKFSEAEVEFRTALKIDSRSRDAALGLANSIYFQKRYAEAIPLLEALASGPNPPAMLFFILATCYDNLHVIQKALHNYEHFLELSKGQSPDHEWQATQRAKLLRHQLQK